MKTPVQMRSARGFSLLEVLVAIVILSVGLLALAALQLALIRASNDTKAQTTAMSLAKEKIETLAAYTTMGGAVACYSPASTPVAGQSSCYRMITTQSSPAETISGIGGVDYTRTTSIGRYIWRTSSSSFVDPTTGGFTNIMLDSGVKAACPTCLTGKEFKRVLVTVSWTDAQGTVRSVQAEDAIPGLSPSDSIAVNSTASFGAPRQAIAIIPNQASVQGVIPIAIGNGSDTAATNPRPVIVSQGNSSTTTEVRFDIYTYAAINGSSATAQSRVETAVVGCKCTQSSGTHTAFRPTYWNGFKYVAPVTLAGIPNSVPTNNVTQSALCTACCRDHHDPSGVAAPLYDPRRTNHYHYLTTNLTSEVTTAGNYDEACRLIRVDGVFRVAAEPYADHYGLLATVSVANSSKVECATPTACTSTETASAFPATGTGSVTALYQTFVLNYLNTRFVTGTAYNTVTNPTGVTGYTALQTPATASIRGADPKTTPQFMHTRGLYIDYLHTDAIAAIASAKATCLAAGCTDAEKQTAVLKLLPFTSINTTEVAGPGWTSDVPGKMTVSNLNDLSATINVGLPAAGKSAFISGNAGDAIIATTQIQRSSAGLSVTNPTNEIIFPSSQLANNIMSDTQPYQIVGAVVAPAESFTLEIDGSSFRSTAQSNSPWGAYFGNNADIIVSPNLSCQNTGADGDGDGKPDIRPYTCSTVAGGTVALGGDIKIVFTNYNRLFSGNDGKPVGNGCSNDDPKPLTPMPYLRDFDVDSVSPSPVSNTVVSGTLDTTGEKTTVDINPVAANSTVTFTMSSPHYLCPTNWATFINNAGNAITVANNQCEGGNNKVPKWAATYSSSCPSSLTFP
jgi:prepilin-type N-terminal cleavage/methylation domain-containing protein